MIDVKYKNIYNKFIERYKNIHVNPWHEISECELERLYDSLINSMDIDDEYSFKYFMDYIIKRLSGKEDAHTKYDLVSLIPMNFRIFDDEILINYPDDLKNGRLISINGIGIDKIVSELEEVITYGTAGKRKYELEKALFNRYVLFSLPSLRDSDGLTFRIKKVDGEETTRTFYKSENYSCEEMFDYNRYRYGENASNRI